MNSQNISQNIYDVISQFKIPYRLRTVYNYGNGHINETYCVICTDEYNHVKRYILQKMNVSIFKVPGELITNIANVTSFLKEKILENGGDPERETLTLIPTIDNKDYLTTENGDNYRLYNYIENAISLDAVRNQEDFYNCAVSFGNFQRLLSDFPADTLYETIPDFHNTVDRLLKFKKAVSEDICDRRKNVEKEIQFVLDREKDCEIILNALNNKEIPLRVTHNDTKLNNIMLDVKTGKGICVIDLDTVMPGSILYDYGDSIRFGANTGAEDETNLDLVSCDLNLFEVYTKGYIEGCGGSLTEKEISMLPIGAKLMTLECGMRFLTDYLQNDVYFKIHREGHNLDRARTQFKLVADMEAKWDKMQAIVKKYQK